MHKAACFEFGTNLNFSSGILCIYGEVAAELEKKKKKVNDYMVDVQKESRAATAGDANAANADLLKKRVVRLKQCSASPGSYSSITSNSHSYTWTPLIFNLDSSPSITRISLRRADASLVLLLS